MKSTIRQKFEQAQKRATELAKLDDRTDDQEQELVDQLDRAEQLKADLDAEAERDARLDALAEVSRSVAIPGQLVQGRTAEPAQLTAGEYIVAVVGLMSGQMSTDEFVDRAARYMPDEVLDRADVLTTDLAGIVPEPVIGPIIDLYDSRRRVFNSFTARSMPSKGSTFDRPKVTQHVAVDEQAAQGDPLARQKMTVGFDPVAKRTFGGTLEIPRQVVDWTDPNAVGLFVADFVKVYNRRTETAAIAHLVALASATSPYVPTDLAATVESYVNAALAVGSSLDDDVPLTLWMDTVTAAGHTKPVGSTDRTEWSVIRQALDALDSNVNVVVSRRLPAATRIFGAGELVEGYEQRHGLISVASANALTTDISYSGYNAFHGIASGFVSLEV